MPFPVIRQPSEQPKVTMERPELFSSTNQGRIHLLPVQYSHQKFHFRLWITQVDGAADEHEWIRMDALHQLSFSALLCSDQVLTSEYYSSCSNRTGKMLPTLGNSVKVVPTFGLHHF
ncbi:hypothetical protein POM88_046490 [Heracleum sosnowskyi]|uniref:Uncharacterized protein n=1 Tax=Heracleum sosnowskyi TaxID=360622 RepID=A0AAD8H7Y3_9APIA|nr:hypothetical protein POM88_046490 [Heracleum sosnowskyi]